MAYRRDPNPPPPNPHLHVTRLRAGQTFQGWILSQEIEGVWTHWDGRRSLPCEQNGAPCPADRHRLPQRWKGYLHCLPLDGEVTTVVELTAEAARQIKSQSSNLSRLRGNLLELQRGKKSNNSRLTARLLVHHHNPSELPGAKDPIPSLEHLWGSTSEQPCINDDAGVE